MALKGPKTRARVGEQPVAGDVRPVTNQALMYISLGVVLLVVAATTAIIVASAGTKKRVPVSTNVPRGTRSVANASYRETVNLPALLRNAPAPSDPAKSETAAAAISLTCTTSCTDGRYVGFAGTFTLAVSGSRLTGSVHSGCQDASLVLDEPHAITAPARLPQTLTGTLTRTSTCPGTEVASPAALRLVRS